MTNVKRDKKISIRPVIQNARYLVKFLRKHDIKFFTQPGSRFTQVISTTDVIMKV